MKAVARPVETSDASRLAELPPELRAVVLGHLRPSDLCRFAGVHRLALADTDAVSCGAVSALRDADPTDVATKLVHMGGRVERHVAVQLGLLPKDKKAPPHVAVSSLPRGASVRAIVDAALGVPDAASDAHDVGLWTAARTQRLAHATTRRAKAHDLTRRRGEAQAKRIAQIATWLRAAMPFGPDVLDFTSFEQRIGAMNHQVHDYFNELPSLYMPGVVRQFVSDVVTTAPKFEVVRLAMLSYGDAVVDLHARFEYVIDHFLALDKSVPTSPVAILWLSREFSACCRAPYRGDTTTPLSLQRICLDIERGGERNGSGLVDYWELPDGMDNHEWDEIERAFPPNTELDRPWPPYSSMIDPLFYARTVREASACIKEARMARFDAEKEFEDLLERQLRCWKQLPSMGLAESDHGDNCRGQWPTPPTPPTPPTNVAPNALLAVLSAYVRQRVAGLSL